MSLLKVLASLSKFKKHPSEFTMSFLKEGQQWFAFIPYYPLSKDDLEMVLGADVFLSYLCFLFDRSIYS